MSNARTEIQSLPGAAIGSLTDAKDGPFTLGRVAQSEMQGVKENDVGEMSD